MQNVYGVYKNILGSIGLILLHTESLQNNYCCYDAIQIKNSILTAVLQLA